MDPPSAMASSSALPDGGPPPAPVLRIGALQVRYPGSERPTLDGLDPETVDMLTVVLVVSSATRAVPRGDGGSWVYTPRGYAAKLSE